jgi:hypothetical protein
VRLRYADVPTFLSVNQVVAGYTVQGTISVGTDVLNNGAFEFSEDMNLGVGGTFTDNPVVTYAPVAGRDFAQLLLAPLQPPDLFGLLLAGLPADLVLGLGLRSLNGLQNERAGSSGVSPADGAFREALSLLVELWSAGALSANPEGAGNARSVGLTLQQTSDPTISALQQRLRRLLGLEQGARELPVVYDRGLRSPSALAVRTRSLIEVLGQLAADVDVPEGDLESGRTYRVAESQDPESLVPRLVVRNGLLEPGDALVSAYYSGRWFWIDDKDLASKRVFSFVMLLLSLAQSVQPGQPPVITIPAG